MNSINILEKLDLVDSLWNPEVIAKPNGQQVKLAKIKGEYIWDNCKNQDTLFYVLKGTMFMEYRDRKIEVNPGEMIVVPKGMEHRPVTQEEVWILMFEPTNVNEPKRIIEYL